jgi:Tfp pilus assembly PilM family ATPase
VRAVIFALDIDLSDTNQTVAILNIGEITTQFVIFQQYTIILNQYWQTTEVVQLENQVQRAIHLYFPSNTLSRFVLVGKADEFAKQFSNSFTCPVSYVNPFKKMRCDFQHDNDKLVSRLLISCGLAMRGVSI